MAEILYIASFGILKLMSVPARMGVEVATGVAFGNVAVCAPEPIETKATLGPSLTMRTTLPCPGRVVDVLAASVTEIGFVLDVAVNGRSIE